MEFSDLVRMRRSVRRYDDRPVPMQLLERICDAGRWAPSAMNMQPWEFIVVTDPVVKGQLGDSAGVMGMKWPHIKAAPAVIVLCAKNTSRFAHDDCLLAAENMLLQATEFGLGTCYIGGFSPERIRQLLSIPSGYVVPGMITVGYPAAETKPPEKRPLSELMHRNTFEGRGVGVTGYRRAWQTFVKLLKERFRGGT